MPRLAKKESEALQLAIEYFEQEGLPIVEGLKSLAKKLEAKVRDVAAEGTLSAAKIENALVKYSAGRVVPVIAARDFFWIKQARAWAQINPTEQQVETVGRWLAKQTWMAATTIDRVVYQWPSFLGRATADRRSTGVAVRKEFTGEE